MTNLSKVCVLPFTHLATHPDGHTSFCCISEHKNCASHAKRGGRAISLNDVSIREMINSETFKEVRLEMLDGKEPSACKRCYDEERDGIKSKRQEENGRYLESSMPVIENLQKDGTIVDMDFQFVELRLGNICNLKCRTCNPVSSSKWKKDYSILQKELDFVADYSDIDDGVWFEKDSFWGELLHNSENLKRIYVNGGEPTLVEKHFSFLYSLIEMDRAKILPENSRVRKDTALALSGCANTIPPIIPVINPPICAALSIPVTEKPRAIVITENPAAPQNNQRNSCG